MKFNALLSITALCAIALFPACKNDSTAAKDAAADTAADQTAAGAPTTDPALSTGAAAPTIAPVPGADVSAVAPAPAPGAKPTEPPQNAAGVWHYTCSKGCAGGAGAAVACAKCGNTLSHNTAYHGTPNPAATATPAGADKTAAKPPEPAQNKAGVWHYTCADGCPGGAGAATACAKCGKTLAHNSAYHQ